MFSVHNPGQFPVFIRDLQLYVQGGKTLDLDLKVRRDTSNRSTDLEKLFRSKKLVLIEKDGGGEVAKAPPRSSKKETGGDKRDIVELKKGIADIMEFLKSGNFGGGTAVPQAIEERDPETLKQLAELQANSLANKTVETKTNFDKIGTESISEKDNVDDMLDILDNLDF
jgi:hypothetical protein